MPLCQETVIEKSRSVRSNGNGSDILPLSDDEIRKIHKYIRQNGIRESKHLIPVAKPVLDMTCPFRDNGKKICKIYEVRPEICRQFICDNEQQSKMNRERLRVGRCVFSMREVFFGAD